MSMAIMPTERAMRIDWAKRCAHHPNARFTKLPYIFQTLRQFGKIDKIRAYRMARYQVTHDTEMIYIPHGRYLPN
jgi:hypothetical protein